MKTMPAQNDLNKTHIFFHLYSIKEKFGNIYTKKAGCATVFRDRVWHKFQVYFLFVKRNLVLCSYSIEGQSKNRHIDKRQYGLFVTQLYLLILAYTKAILIIFLYCIVQIEVNEKNSVFCLVGGGEDKRISKSEKIFKYCPSTLSNFKLIYKSIFELESGDQKFDRHHAQ